MRSYILTKSSAIRKSSALRDLHEQLPNLAALPLLGLPPLPQATLTKTQQGHLDAKYL